MPTRRTCRGVVALAGEPARDPRRALLADWCRLVGRRLGQPESEASDATGPAAVPEGGVTESRTAASVADLDLPPRVGQTLVRLLAGRSEKQIALDLGVSPHTVHTYVKQLHKRLNVNSRGELLALFVGGRRHPAE
jgi:DNA-binding CsgD family transcriptional regulator